MSEAAPPLAVHPLVDPASARTRSHAGYGLLVGIQGLLELFVLSIFIACFLVQPSRISSESMEPTLKVGDFLLVDKQSFFSEGVLQKVLPPIAVHRGDLVVFHFPIDPSRRLVKRVVGLPGDTLKMIAGRLQLNGVMLPEPYAFYSKSRPENFRDNFPSLLGVDPNVDPDGNASWWRLLRTHVSDGSIVVPADSYFVLGDNRNDSDDSRYWGFVPRGDLVGRPLVVYFALPPLTGEPPAPRLPLVASLRLRLHAAWNNVHILR